jgi:HSP20 family molecular chaperone IbpA
MKSLSTIVPTALLAFLLGLAAMWYYQETNRSDPLALDDSLYQDLFDDRFFERSRSPFEEMERMREEMDRMFGRSTAMPDFDGWFDRRFGEFPSQQISMREDDDHVYYVLDTGDQTVADVSVTTENNQVAITAKLEEVTENSRRSFSLNQRFPVPANVVPESATVRFEDGEIIVEFDKKRS